jgi:hypothetical protein
MSAPTIFILSLQLILLGTLITFILWFLKKESILKDKSQDDTCTLEGNKQLTANLNLITNKDHMRFAENRNALIDFFTNLNEWIWDGLNIGVQDYNHTNYQELSGKIVRMKEYYNKANVSFGRLQLLFQDDKLLKAGYEAILESLKLHHFVETTLKNFQRTLSWEKSLLDKITSKDYDFFKMTPDLTALYEKQARETEITRKEILDGYNDKHWELFNPVIRKRNEFRDLAKKEISEERKSSSNGLSQARWNEFL